MGKTGRKDARLACPRASQHKQGPIHRLDGFALLRVEVRKIVCHVSRI